MKRHIAKAVTLRIIASLTIGITDWVMRTGNVYRGIGCDDVAYRYFNPNKRKFMIADTLGHK